jgi:hypothetical protein
VEVELSLTSVASAAIEANLSQLQVQLTASMALRAERRALADRIVQARKLAQISGALAIVKTERHRYAELLREKMSEDPREKRTSLEIEATTVRKEISAYKSKLRQHDDRMLEVIEAVSTIAHRLAHDDTRCPVCTTVFPLGRLSELARAQAALDTIPATHLATALAEARVKDERLKNQIAEVDARLAEIQQLEVVLAFHSAREGELRQDLVNEGGVADAIYNETVAIRIEQELNILDTRLSQGAALEDLKDQIEAADAELKAEAAKRSSLQQTLSDVFEASHTARSILLQSPDLWNAEQGIVVDLEFERETAEKLSKEASEQLVAAQAYVLALRATQNSLQEVVAHEEEVIASLAARQELLRENRLENLRLWGRAGQPSEPNGTFLIEQRARLDRNSACINSTEDALQLLINGYRKWLGNEQLRKLEDAIASTLIAESVELEDQVIDILRRRVATARGDINLAQKAKLRVETVGSTMKQRAGTYTDEVLVPLNSTIKRFARALMTWSDESISYHAEHTATRSELRPGIVKRGVDGSTTQMEMNPNLYFSEGQLSALSVAALLAASTTFSWSRWKGLLLDDPLQHNDVIHASAFMDVLRQLVNGLGYQIILSTHDSAEAEFLSRKCRSAGIPYQIHELAPRSEEGLVHMSDRLSNLRAARSY